jgi:putative Holliday junction resolvase
MIALGVDLGERRIGLAASSAEGTLARPLAVIEHRSLGEDVKSVGEVAARLGAQKIVVGLPLNMNGTVGPAARRARRFANALRRALGIGVELWDERLTTVEAEGIMGGGGPPGKVDKVAAAIILQSYLDAAREADR